MEIPTKTREIESHPVVPFVHPVRRKMAEASKSTLNETLETSIGTDGGKSDSRFPEIFCDDQPSSSQAESGVPKSCAKAFDSVYYCYSPFHQARNYYIEGQLDDCRGRLRRFRLCLLARLKPQSEAERMYQEEEQRERESKNLDGVKPVWDLRPEFADSVRRAEEQELRDGKEQEEKSSWWL